MTNHNPPASIPVAWLKPMPDGYQIALWRWVLLPATTIMLKRYGGVWVNGTLELTATDLRFTQAKAIKRAGRPAETWTIPLDTISRVAVSKGLASETLEIDAGKTFKLMTARAESFIERLRRAAPSA